ncbi:MAG: hypothetical protein AAGI53_01555 [Planctomycetota bacterium]
MPKDEAKRTSTKATMIDRIARRLLRDAEAVEEGESSARRSLIDQLDRLNVPGLLGLESALDTSRRRGEAERNASK